MHFLFAYISPVILVSVLYTCVEFASCAHGLDLRGVQIFIHTVEGLFLGVR